VTDAHAIELDVNGRRHHVVVEARRTLADVLRQDLGLTGTHLGCEHGICGACTVLVDGQPARSCLLFGVQLEGRRIETVEGLADDDGTLSPLQEAFSEHHGLQCGFCTPGFLMLATGLLREDPAPSDEEVRDAAAANLCRCTGYQGILDAIRAVACHGDDPSTDARTPEAEVDAGGTATT
jgi:aerobic-type carbon monoxide dehydrogenase small subunit (CoxS/CutS family)